MTMMNTQMIPQMKFNFLRCFGSKNIYKFKLKL